MTYSSNGVYPTLSVFSSHFFIAPAIKANWLRSQDAKPWVPSGPPGYRTGTRTVNFYMLDEEDEESFFQQLLRRNRKTSCSFRGRSHCRRICSDARADCCGLYWCSSISRSRDARKLRCIFKRDRSSVVTIILTTSRLLLSTVLTVVAFQTGGECKS